MKISIDIGRVLHEHVLLVEQLHALIPDIAYLANRMAVCLRSGGKILWMGNGGSASDSQHLAAELVGRFHLERKGFASIALTTDTSILTAVGNDYGFEQIFARQIEALCKAEDLVVGISTSGNSANVIEGLRAAKLVGAYCAALTGRDGGHMRNLCDTCLIVPSLDTARIQEAHILIGHILCQCIDSTILVEGF